MYLTHVLGDLTIAANPYPFTLYPINLRQILGQIQRNQPDSDRLPV